MFGCSDQHAPTAPLHERFSTNRTGWFPWLFDHVVLPADSRILELGCGPGWLWLKNSTRIPPTWDVTLSDFSAGMVEDAQHRLRETAHPFTFAVMDAQAIPFPPATFDAVIANHMLYRVPDRPRALAEIRRVLKPRGHFYASTVGPRHLCEMASFIPDHGDDFGAEYPFDLENGGVQLARFFSHIECDRYDDALVVTDAEPLIAYLLSTRVASSLDDDARVMLRKGVETAMAATGSVHELDNRKDQVMTVLNAALTNVAMWARDQWFPASYAHATWARLAPFFRLPGRVVWGESVVTVELRPFNDRPLTRDLAKLCERVGLVAPRLPDGRRLVLRIAGEGRPVLDVQTQAVA